MKDLPMKPRYLVTFTVSYNQKKNVDAAVKKVGINYDIMIFSSLALTGFSFVATMQDL